MWQALAACLVFFRADGDPNSLCSCPLDIDNWFVNCDPNRDVVSPQLHNHFKISLRFWPHFVLWFIFLGPWFPCLQKTPKHVKLWQQIASVYCSLNISHFDSFNWAAGQRKCMFPNRGFSTWAEFLILVSLLTCCRGEGRAKHFATKTGKYENAARYSWHVHLYLYVHIYIFIQF